PDPITIKIRIRIRITSRSNLLPSDLQQPMRRFHHLLAALFLALPLLARAGAPGYRVAAGWPAGGREAPDYASAGVSAVTTDREGNVYVFQRAAHPVLVFDRAGRFLRTWGAGLFTNPHGCRIDPEGNLWLTDNSDHRVMKFTREGKLLATFGV